jgi:formylmethanofuran dehydrogenase subunit A
VVADIECDAGCGVVPFRYREQSYVNALQWTIGLELFLQVRDPWRVVLTTDHPNGAPFTSYPHLMRLLMDKAFRDEQLARLHPDVAAGSALRSIARELSLYEIAIMTRAAPARLLGLRDRGHLGAGAAADVAVYREQGDAEAMFSRAAWVFKDGEPVVRDGRVVATPAGGTHFAEPVFDAGVQGLLEARGDRPLGLHVRHAAIGREELCSCGNRGRLFPWACEARSV